MKIKSIYISAFGKLEDFSLDFSDGFTTVYGDNENGKSTIMAFIKMMFYGSKGGTKLKNPRNLYAPWSNKAMAGSITFEQNGKNYRLEREFKSSNSTDKVTLIDLDLSEKIHVGADIGAELFDLSETAFEKSIHISTLMSDDAEGEFGAKLANISASGDEDISYKKIFARLEKCRNRITSKKGTAGEMDKNRARYALLEEQLRSQNLAWHNIIELKEKARLLEQRLSATLNNYNQSKKTLDSAQIIKKKEKLRELLSLKEQLDKLNELLALSDGKTVGEVFVGTLTFQIAKIENYLQKISAKENEKRITKENLELLLKPSPEMTEENALLLREDIKAEEERLSQAEKDILSIEEKSAAVSQGLSTANSKNKAFNPLLLVFGCVGILGALILLLLNFVLLSYCIGAAGIVLAVLSLILKSKQSTSSKELDLLEDELSAKKLYREQISSKLALLNEKLNSINAVLNSNTDVIEKQKGALLEIEEELTMLLKSKSEEEEKLLEFYSKYKPNCTLEDIENDLEFLKETTYKQKEIKQQLNYISRDLDNISYEDAKRLLENDTQEFEQSVDVESLSTECERLSNEAADLKSELSAIKTEILMLEKRTRNPEATTAEMASLKKNIDLQAEFCDASQIAMDILTQSQQELRKSYGSGLEKRATEIFSSLTENAYADMLISDSFEINVEKQGVFGQKELEYLSAGTTDQAYLSLRLALSELLSGDETLPIFLDDSLMQYDDRRLAAAIKFLKEFSAEKQIIMFTCHSFISNLSENFGSEIKTLEK